MYNRSFGATTGGGDVWVGWTPRDALMLRAYAAYSQRPLVYRYDDSYVSWTGLDVNMKLSPQLVLGASGVYVYEDRNRPDAAAFSWNQTRVSAFITYVLSVGGSDHVNLPNAVKKMPSAAGYQR
jgi:hypothetical protein